MSTLSSEAHKAIFPTLVQRLQSTLTPDQWTHLRPFVLREYRDVYAKGAEAGYRHGERAGFEAGWEAAVKVILADLKRVAPEVIDLLADLPEAA